MEHVIRVEVSGAEGEGGNSFSISSATTRVAPAANGIANTGISSMVKRFLPAVGIGYVGASALSAGKNLVSGSISRIGEYTGDTLRQNEIDNTLKALSLGKSALLNPLGFAVSTIFAFSDFNLNIRKTNATARYAAILAKGGQ